ncbi:hypothetical protein ACRAVF_04720 [Bradyrhizobium oligotrophicum S58]
MVEESTSQQPNMVKSLLAVATFVLLGASILALPGFSYKAPSGEAVVMTKGDRLKTEAFLTNCSTQIWPEFAASCLRGAASGGTILEARLVTTRR